MRGYGKKFEQEMKHSLEAAKKEQRLVYSKNEVLGGRFFRQPELLPDFFVQTCEGRFFLLECKSCQLKRLFPFKNLKVHQNRDLRMVSKWPNSKGYLLINFRSSRKVTEGKWNETFIVNIKTYYKYKKETGRSSFEREWIRENCREIDRAKIHGLTKNGCEKIQQGWDLAFLFREKHG